MERVLNLAGKNSSEIFQLRYPYSLLTFCDYDLSYFAENAIAVCDEALHTGVLDAERATDLRNSLRNMHVWIEHNLRTVYDKIVLDCWIDYVCRRDNIGTTALWNRFIDCKSAFEKAVFVRLCEYRYNKGINEWLNLVRVQDYAKSKIYFLFSREISGADEANARRNYFDLMFSVTARELGCRLEDLGVTQVFSTGRVPSAPFMYPNISKDIIKNLLPDFDYSDDYSDIGSYECLSDQIAMDAFSHMKAGLAQEFTSYNMSRAAMEHTPLKVYMPCGLKAVVDLEIDALIESGGWLARCKRCGRYFVRDSEHTEEYCSLPVTSGKTCLELYEMEHPRSRVTPEAEKLCNEIIDEMYGRVSSGSMSLKEYESWKLYLEAMKGKVNNGEISPDDLTAFINYSRTMDITRSKPVSQVRKPEPERPQGRVVKPFVPERISRSDIERQPEEKPPEPVEIPAPQPRREGGFFTSPSVERQRQVKAPVSHIIRAGEQLNYQAPPAFVPGAVPAAQSRQPEQTTKPAKPAQEQGFTAFAEEPQRYSEPEVAVQHVVRSAGNPAGEYEQSAADERFERTERTERINRAEPTEFTERSERNEKPHFVAFTGTEFEPDPAPVLGVPAAENELPDFEEAPEEPVPEWEKASKPAEAPRIPEAPAEPEPAPRPRVIRKNAAAISAYGKIAGTPLGTAEQTYEAVSRPEPENESAQYGTAGPESPVNAADQENSANPAEPEKDPFWEFGSIFDVLEQSESDMSKPIKIAEEPADKPSKPVQHRKPKAEHAPEKGQSTENHRPARKRAAAEHSEPEEAVQHEQPEQPEVPNGIWTEERHLFDGENPDTSAHEELNMLKDKKRGRSSKTQRLFDAIMRESDDNPNFRKK